MVILVVLLSVLALGSVIAILIAILARRSARASSDARHPISGVIPKRAKVIASSLFGLAITVGIIAGALAAVRDPNTWTSPISGGFVGLLGGTFVGGLFAVWVLGLGYVYGDADRREMPAILWLLVAALVPNLLGFLLYFVLRKPLGHPCPQCGQAITPEQRFCSWCGAQQYAAPYTTTVAPPSSTASGVG